MNSDRITKNRLWGVVIIRLFLILLFCLPAWISAQVTVAIGDFQNRSGRIYLDAWEQRIPDFLQSALSRESGIVLVQRDNLQALLDEHTLSMTGLVDSSTARQVGRLLSAQYIISGTIHLAGEGLRIDACVIHVNTGRLVVENVWGPSAADMDRMVDMLGDNLKYQLTGKGVYKTRLVMRKHPATYFLIGSLGTAAAAAIANSAYQSKLDDYHAADRLDDFDPAYNKANALYQTRTVLIWATAFGLAGTIYCWIKNIDPPELVAEGPKVQPYLWKTKDEVAVGFQVSF